MTGRAPGSQGAAVVPPHLVQAWEAAYRHYSAMTQRTRQAGDALAAHDMAVASLAVAAAWRELAAQSRLPWWVLAAVTAAAEGFEDNAQSWEIRAYSEEGQGRGVQRDVEAGTAGGRGDAGQWFGEPGAGDLPGSGQPGDPAAVRSGRVAGVHPAPSPNPRQRGRTGRVPRQAQGGTQ